MSGSTTNPVGGLSMDDARKVARLSRLALTDEQLAQYREQLGAVLGYVEQLQRLDLSNVEPMAHAGDSANRMDDDLPRDGLPTEALMKMAPESVPPFIKVPKVIGDGGGA